MTYKSLLTFLLAIAANLFFNQAFAQCNPDNTPPDVTGCPLFDTTYYISDPGACTWPSDIIDPIFTDACSSINVLSASRLEFGFFLMGPGGGSIEEPLEFGTDSVKLFGVSTGTAGLNSQSNYCFYIFCDGTLSFDFTGRMSNGDLFPGDRARIMIENAVNGTNSVDVLTTGNGGFLAGSRSIAVSKGDRICFEINSDNILGIDTLTLKNLILTSTGDPTVMYLGPTPYAQFTCGNFQGIIYALDCSGNLNLCRWFRTIIDTTKPIISDCPLSQVIELDINECDRVVTWVEPTAVDPCPYNPEFVGPFAPELWTNNLFNPYVNSPLSGTDAIIDHTPSLLSITGSNNGFPGEENQTYTGIIIPCNGTISFDWSATIPAGGAFRGDEAGYYNETVGNVLLSLPLGANNASGTVTAFPVIAGESIAFFVNSDNRSFETTLEISNFVFTPEPTVITQISGPLPETALPPGHYDVVYEANSCCGNRQCKFSIDVIGISALACHDLVVSLDEFCEATITPAAVLSAGCASRCKVVLSHYGKPVPNPIDSHYLGQTITATVIDTMTGNSCWSYLTIEDKLAPKIVCTNDTMSCYEFINTITPGEVEDCSKYTVRLLDEIVDKLDCDPDFIKKITRVWITQDLSGTLSDTCTQMVWIERFRLDTVKFPVDTVLLCDGNYALDADGHPHPYVVGVPTYKGDTIWPTTDFLCNVATDYVDTDLGEIRCTRKIMRNWRVREWWCGTELTRNWTQFIQIKDTVGPRIIHAPYDFHATTGHKSCYASIDLPPIEAVDACHSLYAVDIAYPGGILKNQNGGHVLLPTGENVIVYRLYDNCYNLTTDTLIVTVKDETQPVAICDRRTVVSLNHSGYNWVPAGVFDDGSFDECHLHHFEVRRMDDNTCGTTGPDDWGPEVGFCCEDVGHEVMVGFKAIDASGNESVCMVMVAIQDKDLPLISCPPDITIDCRYPIDLNRLEVFGRVVTSQADRKKIVIDTAYWHMIDGHPQDGLATDNCPPIVIERVDSSNFKQCGDGYIVRWFIARDAQGNEATCHQTISISNHKPFDHNSIVWPLDLDTSGICNTRMIAPELLPAPYNRPTFNDDVCSVVGVSYTDHEFSQTVPGFPCYKVFRVWKVIDWCQRDQGGNLVIWSDTQIIKMANLVDPRITKVCRDTTICTYDVQCRPVPVRLSIDAEDDCTAKDQLLYRYKVDLNSDGTIDIDKATIGDPVATGTWPLGKHIIKWEVEDRCGNTAKCQSQLNLINCKTPTAYCHRDISVGLVAMDLNGDGIPDTKMVTVWASDVDAGSSHNCGYPVKLSFSRDTADKFRVYTCDSLGLRNVDLWVTDINGNTSVCKTRIIIWDNPQNAPKCPGTFGNVVVNGLISTEGGSKVQSVEVEATSNVEVSSMTNFEGEYEFTQLPTTVDYIIKPTRNDDWLNGVTTADIVKIQKHILGTEIITSPYKMIAADVNKSKSISARDIADLRKLILGVTNSISSNTSWRFVDQLYQFTNIDETLNENLAETYQINGLNSNMNINFIGIKIGDINETAKTRGVSKIESRSDNPLTLIADNKKIAKDEVYDIEVKASNIADYVGMQYTLQFNNEMIDVIGIQGNTTVGMSAENFNLLQANKGIITSSWNGHAANNDVLFTIKVKAKKECDVMDIMFISSSVTPALAIHDNDEEYQVVMRVNGTTSQEFILLQNEPNPWKDKSVISMYLPHAGEVRMSIHDVNGKMIYMQERNLIKGYQEWEIEKSILPNAGVYYYQVDFENNSQTKKMIVIE